MRVAYCDDGGGATVVGCCIAGMMLAAACRTSHACYDLQHPNGKNCNRGWSCDSECQPASETARRVQSGAITCHIAQAGLQ